MESCYTSLPQEMQGERQNGVYFIRTCDNCLTKFVSKFAVKAVFLNIFIVYRSDEDSLLPLVVLEQFPQLSLEPKGILRPIY